MVVLYINQSEAYSNSLYFALAKLCLRNSGHKEGAIHFDVIPGCCKVNIVNIDSPVYPQYHDICFSSQKNLF